MKTHFDGEFYTSDFDQSMMDFVADKYGKSPFRWEVGHLYLKYGVGNNYFWTSDIDYEGMQKLTKQQFKEKIGMTTKQFTKADLVAGMLITLRNGYTYTLKSCLNRMERAEGFMEMGDYLEDFTHKDECSGWDIVNIVYPTQVWKRTPPKTESQIQLEKLQQHITELQAQADKLKATL